MTIFCYPNCSTCKRAVDFLQRRALAYAYRNIKTDRPDKQELARIIKQSSLPMHAFFNTSGQLYRSLSIKDLLPTLKEEQVIELLASDGMLVKRPLLITERGVLVGFKQKEWEAFFGL